VQSAKWFKSSRSGSNGQCVETAYMSETVAVRDSKNRDGAVLAFPRENWASFVEGIKRGDFTT